MNSSTKDRILDAAERLFALQGFAQTSIRAIVAEADVNLAAIHYHFGSKETLIQEILTRRIDHINAERLRLLDVCMSQGNDQPPALEAVVEAFVAPTLRLGADTEHGGQNFARIMARLHSDPGKLHQLIKSKFKVVSQEFVPALQDILPNLSLDEIHWRLKFAVGAMIMTMFHNFQLDFRPADQENTPNIEDILSRLVTFVSAGLRAQPEEE